METKVLKGDCRDVLADMELDCVDLVYADPPFFTQKVQRLKTRDGSREFSFSDLWSSNAEYADFIYERVVQIHRVMSPRASVYFHCDRNATHIIRAVLDEVFGNRMLRSEIIWHYRRWSNSRKAFLPSHQTIYMYTKGEEYTFNTIYEDYSPSTNVDQILQLRRRNKTGKSVYARSLNGEVVAGPPKKGVPLGDVWDIPYLNPKAKERTGYPTQKPLLLLERILQVSSSEGDLVLDPFCGSGTTLVAAKLMSRRAVGIDESKEAIKLTKSRLKLPKKTESRLMRVGRDAYREACTEALSLLQGLDFSPVHRNMGIDAVLKEHCGLGPVPVRIQRMDESISEAANLLYSASKGKNAGLRILVAIHDGHSLLEDNVPDGVKVVRGPALQVKELLQACDR